MTPQRYAEGLEAIEAAARDANRTIERFDAAHLLFVRIDDNRDRALDDATAILSRRYAMDSGAPPSATARWATPTRLRPRSTNSCAPASRHVILDLLGAWDESRPQLERFSEEVRPKLRVSGN